MLWEKLKYFKSREFTRPELMSGFILLALDEIREEVGLPFVVTSSYRNGGSGNHQGFAVDGFFVPGIPRVSALERVQRAMIAVDGLLLGNSSGVGLYLDWKSGNLGFHFDFKRGGSRRWSRDGTYKSWQYAIEKLKQNPEKW